MWKNSSCSALVVLQELDVVDQEDIAGPISSLECGAGVGAEGFDELVHERFGGDVAHVVVREGFPNVMAYGVKQVGLAQAGSPVDEERVVCAGGCRRDPPGCRVREAVGCSDDERIEGVPGD